MSFFDKVKQGASDAAKKAQQTVEITKLKSQISGKEKDMEQLFHNIGASVYRAHQAGGSDESEEEVAGFLRQLDEMQTEIDLLEERIKNIRYEKSCSCGKVVPLDARFCPDCGAQLGEEPKPETTIGEIRVICSHCLTENELNSKFCLTCGSGLSSTSSHEDGYDEQGR
ncbi:zinc ribbon domain-containing protein [Paenibacillus mendelii]|uniref:Zinc ribbon domain-containing protein n=1 Tax=Paenibacillus mendelii TaxID=206163 RepID=A0ABV6JKF9_9BACL|nr:zinc ribbon domain-containing protein [Paenibacillus mendelii]MCQ6558914.1 zinc ribbon domain-containing protein [Paenibacillus mendelii]